MLSGVEIHAYPQRLDRPILQIDNLLAGFRSVVFHGSLYFSQRHTCLSLFLRMRSSYTSEWINHNWRSTDESI